MSEPTERHDEDEADHREAEPNAGLLALQAAAREMISAARTVLDVAEDLVDDPNAAEVVMDTFASLAAAARGAMRAPGAPQHRNDGHAGDDDGPGGVEHIPLS